MFEEFVGEKVRDFFGRQGTIVEANGDNFKVRFDDNNEIKDYNISQFRIKFLRFIDENIEDEIQEEIRHLREVNNNVRIVENNPREELAIKIGKSEPTIHRHIDALVSKGIVKRVGSRKTGYWEIK